MNNDKVIADLQAIIAELQVPVPPVDIPPVDSVVSITISWQSGATSEFVPKV